MEEDRIQQEEPLNKLTRKRKRQPNRWEVDVEKRKRYTAKRQPGKPQCKHEENSVYKCKNMDCHDIISFFEAFYYKKDKIYQDNLILKHCTTTKITRRRPTNGTRSQKNINIKYFVSSKNHEKIRVCKVAFLTVLQINEARVKGVIKRHEETGQASSEMRGGDRKHTMYFERRELIRNFIKKIKVIESHYCRSRSQRLYMESGHSISSLYSAFKKECVEKRITPIATESYFRTIFNTEFNISFACPRTDVCSKCIELNSKIENEKDDARKETLRNELKIHKLRAKAFFEFLQEERTDLKTITFDCQKNQMLPKIPDQLTYFSRQLYKYNFTIVDGHSHAELNKENVTIYTWTENMFPKGPNEISSCLNHFLRNLNLNDCIKTVRLMADGCSSQNKNFILLGTVMKWFKSAPQHLKHVEIIFPVPGHSFIPPDRVFAGIEKVIKKKENIIEPKEYIDIFEKFGQVYELGKDFENYDWKYAVRQVFKTSNQLHFQFNKCKRFILSRDAIDVKVRGEMAYKMDCGVSRKITKFGKSVNDIDQRQINIGHTIKPKKSKDVAKLLSKHFGEDWKNYDRLSFYKNIIDEEIVLASEEREEDTDINHLCDTVMEECSEMYI